MAFWRTETLRKRLKGLINPYDPDKIQHAAYTLGVGPEAYITPHGNHSDPETHTKHQLGTDEDFPIPSGQFAFILTEEQIEIPNNALGFISIRTPLKFKGLVNISGFHVDPGYKGRLVVSVFNAGPSTVSLARGDGILKLWYADLDGTTKDLKTGVHNETISSDLITSVPGQLYSLQGLSKKIDESSQEASKKITEIKIELKWINRIILAAFVLVLGALFRPELAKIFQNNETPSQIQTPTTQPPTQDVLPSVDKK